ncbi:hypothetical protein [Geminocystis sp. GBBB08]|uniref:hypothetical protein n=1 Tax=Geminocystis sp. GBBB08 TaxID=2604140 RepID=UPI0027E35CCC|nr:hypothetical protein [Geminocystis sp. GBBB08]MBL1211446.1 hypothetical protein [Geminocystis sp. GBBB08]
MASIIASAKLSLNLRDTCEVRIAKDSLKGITLPCWVKAIISIANSSFFSRQIHLCNSYCIDGRSHS